MPHHRSPNAGFTLVELSIVLVILSLLTASGLALGTSMVERAAYVDTAKQLAQLEESLRDYYVVNGRLPCPAPWNTLPGHADFGKEEPNCTSASANTLSNNGAWVGMIPVHTLGLPASAASDKFGSRIIYAVTTTMTSADSFGGATGAISIYGESDTTPIQTNMAYALYSHGRDRKGARAYTTGNIPITCGATSNKDVMNCTFSNASRYRDVPFNSGDQAAHFFDDLIRWAPKYHFMALDTSNTGLWVKRADNDNIYSVGADTNHSNTNVGIGLNDPQEKLHVLGPIRVDSSGDFHMRIRNPNAPDGLRNWAIQDTGSAGKLMFRSRHEDWTFKHTLLAMDHDTGNVGIYTSTPAERLHVNGKMRLGNRLTVDPDMPYGSPSGPPGTSIYGLTGTTDHLTLYAQNSSNNGASITLAGRTASFWGDGRITYRASYNTANTRPMHHFYRLDSGGDARPLAEIRANGTLYLEGNSVYTCTLGVSGGGSCTSDARLKQDIEPVQRALDKLLEIKGVYYRWNHELVPDDTNRYLGVLAQDVQKVFPEAVRTNERNGYLTVSMESLIPVMLEAIRELKAENDTLKAQLTSVSGKTASPDASAAKSAWRPLDLLLIAGMLGLGILVCIRRRK